MTKSFALRNDIVYSLGEVISINPSSIGKDSPHQEIQYVDISSVSSGVLNGMAVHNIDDAPSRAKRLVKEGDTILSTVRPNRRSFLFIKNPPENIVVSTGFAVLRASDKIEPGFLYYTVTNQPFTDYLTANAKGAAYPAVDTETIARAEIRVPPLPIQRKIASILSAYDDLIENNLWRIKILEEMAQTLYREWFVKFRFPGHEKTRMVDSPLGKIPEGWEVMQLSELVDLRRKGIQPNNFPDEVFEHFSFPAHDVGKLPAEDRGDTIKSGKYEVPPNCVLVPKLNPHIPRVWLPSPSGYLRSIASTEYLILEPRRYSTAFFCSFFSAPETLDALAGRADGTSTSHKRLKPNDLMSRPMIAPPNSLVAQFDEAAIPALALVNSLTKRNQMLRRSRDLLLPKLISGELDLSDLDIKTGGRMQ